MNEIPFQSTSFQPAPGTTTQGGWDDFLNTVISGAVRIVNAAKQTGYENGPGYGGVNGELLPAQTAGGGSLMGLLVIGLLIFLVVDAT
jgi:hypothetical protein